jgi:hypothetical protein
MVPGPSHGGAIEGEGEETSGSYNEIRLVEARLRRHGLPGVASAAVQALRRLTATTSSRDPTDGEGVGAAAQDCVGAVVERLKGWNHATRQTQMRGEESS